VYLELLDFRQLAEIIDLKFFKLVAASIWANLGFSIYSKYLDLLLAIASFNVSVKLRSLKDFSS